MTQIMECEPAARPGSRVVEAAAVAAVYCVIAVVSLRFAVTYRNVSAVWPPSGFALAALVITRRRAWPGVALGAFLANSITGLPLATSVVIAVGNTLEGLTAAWLLQRLPGLGAFQRDLRRVRDVFHLLVAAAASAVVAATLGPAAEIASGALSDAGYGGAWLTWWVGDAMGMMLVGALLLAWAAPGASSHPEQETTSRAPARRIAEAAALSAILAGICWLVFGDSRPFAYAMFPVLVCIALRFGQRGITAAVAGVFAAGVAATVRGVGPFLRGDVQTSLLFLDSWLAVIALTTFFLGAATDERRTAAAALAVAEGRFRLALRHSAATVYSQDRDLRYTWIYDGRGRFDAAKILGRTDADLIGAQSAAPIEEIKRRVIATGAGERQQVSAPMDGGTAVFDLVVEPVRNVRGQVVGISGIAHDITEIRDYQAAIEDLNTRLRRAMRETHHRVKNNLQAIAAMVDLRLMESADHIPADEFRRIGTHTRTLATVHDLLTDEARHDSNAGAVSAHEMLTRLVTMMRPSTLGRELHLDAEDLRLPSNRATALALIVSELVINAVKHGAGPIGITLRREKGAAVLVVTDCGRGFAADFDPKTATGAGLDLVQNLSRWDLTGEMQCGNTSDGGAFVRVTFPCEAESST